jgi:hypothetical protein
MYQSPIQQPNYIPWNKGKLSGQKRPLKLQEIWAIRFRLQIQGRSRDLALFDLAINSKLRARDLMALTVGDVAQGAMRPALDHFRLSDRTLEGNLLTTACLFALAVNIAGKEVLQPPATLA